MTSRLVAFQQTPERLTTTSNELIKSTSLHGAPGWGCNQSLLIHHCPQALAEQVGVADCTMLAHNKRWAVANIPAHLHNGSGLMTDEAKRDCIEEGLLSWEAFSRLFPRPPEMAGGA